MIHASCIRRMKMSAADFVILFMLAASFRIRACFNNTSL